MSNTDGNRPSDAQIDPDLTHAAADDGRDPSPARLGADPVPDAGDDPDRVSGGVDRESAGDGAAPDGVETVDERAATRDAMRDAAN